MRDDRAPLQAIEHDLHLLDVLDAARLAVAERAAVSVTSTFPRLELEYVIPSGIEHLHDHTRPADDQ